MVTKTNVKGAHKGAKHCCPKLEEMYDSVKDLKMANLISNIIVAITYRISVIILVWGDDVVQRRWRLTSFWSAANGVLMTIRRQTGF
jgi:hypothetical protein